MPLMQFVWWVNGVTLAGLLVGVGRFDSLGRDLALFYRACAGLTAVAHAAVSLWCAEDMP